MRSVGERRRFGGWLRAALLVAGLALVAYFVHSTGPRQLLAALLAARRYAPLFVALELFAIFADTRAFASLVGPDAARISGRGWLRSSALSYVCLMCLPAGRAASEVARASVLARYVGALRSATAGAQMQAAALIADGLISACCALTVLFWVRSSHGLPALLGANVLIALGTGSVLLVLVRKPSVAAALARRFPRLLGKLATGEGTPYTLGLGACAWSLMARFAQLVEYGLAVRAVGGRLGFGNAAVAYGVHVVSATIGVAIPNQVGIADGAYLLFADTLGFAGAPARALAVMFSIRATQVALALVCLGVPLLLRQAPLGMGRTEPRVTEGG